jgi:AcrR family transcriptional regulator
VSPPKKKKQKRARSDEAKELRRHAILEAARRLFEGQSYEALTVELVARQSKLAKGTVYLYFQSKEAIFLELLLSELQAWLASLAAPLERLEKGKVNDVAELLSTSVGERPSLRRLLSLLHSTLERNVDLDSVRSFKLRGAEAMRPTATQLEGCLPQLGVGDGMRLLRHLHALVVGVGQVSDESAVVREVLADPELAVFRVDFTSELRDLLRLILLGWNR